MHPTMTIHTCQQSQPTANSLQAYARTNLLARCIANHSSLHNRHPPVIAQPRKNSDRICRAFQVGNNRTGLPKRVAIGRSGGLHAVEKVVVRPVNVENRIEDGVAFREIVGAAKYDIAFYKAVIGSKILKRDAV